MKNLSLKSALALIAFALSVIAPNLVNAQTNPYYPNPIPPPVVHQFVNANGDIELNVSSPEFERIDTFRIYKEFGEFSLLASGTLENGNVLVATIPTTEVTKGMNWKVTSKQQNSNLEFVEWIDVVVYDICANPNNPFDYYGRIHNEGLDYYINNRTYLGSDSIAVFNDIIGRITEFAQTKPALANESINDISLNTGVLPPAIGNPQVSAFTHALYMTIYSIGNDQLDLYGVSNCVKSIKQLENGMHSYVTNGIVTEEDAADFYKMSAVAKYSITYWYDVASDESSPWRDFEDYGEDEITPPGILTWAANALNSVVSAISSAATAVASYASNFWGSTTNFFGYSTNVWGVIVCGGLDIGGATTGPWSAIISSAVGARIWGIVPGWR